MLLVGLGGATAFAQQAPPPVVVVLIGEARDNAELSAVIAELLLRQNVEAQMESRKRFEPEVWLDESSADARSFAFVSVRERHRAQLYFRGPHGRRFLLRELTLRDGLDEVGRELIARVVETSTVALMSSSEGVTRDEARAELALVTNAQAQPAPEPPPAAPVEQPKRAEPASRKPEQRWSTLLGVRALGQWTGSDLGVRIGLGVEGGARFRTAGWLQIGGRLSAEIALPQQLEAEGVAASVLAIPLRIGVDVGSEIDLFLSLSTGFDIEHLSPERAADSELMLASASTELTPTSRAELRYELALSRSLYLALSALIDVPWTAAHYDVEQDGTLKHLATPWRVQPGAVITLGATP
jgi:hypothetical protein